MYIFANVIFTQYFTHISNFSGELDALTHLLLYSQILKIVISEKFTKYNFFTLNSNMIE